MREDSKENINLSLILREISQNKESQFSWIEIELSTSQFWSDTFSFLLFLSLIRTIRS